jgi:hypothetical protein
MMTSSVVTPAVSVVEESLVRDTVKVSWGSIIAGLVVALGAWVLLSVLGLAVGLSAVDPTEPSSLKSASMVSGVWSIVVPFVALLVGGLVAARTAGVVSRPTGAIHGVVLWALAMIASLALVGYVVRGVVTAAASAGSDVSGALVPGAGGMMDTLGIRSEDLVEPVNRKLSAEGKPTVTAAQLERTIRDVARSGVGEGRLDRELFVTSLARNTGLSRADAEDIATQLDTSLSNRRAEAQREIETGAAKAADRTGKAMWWVFFGMLLGLGSAVVGSTLGVSRRQRLAATHGPGPISGTPAHAHS